MENIIETASSLHNWKQENAIVRYSPRRGGDTLNAQRRILKSFLKASIDKSNLRPLAASARINSLDLVEIMEEKTDTLGIGGLRGAIETYRTHGIVACLQYIDSL